MQTLMPELLAQYLANPLGMEESVRRLFKLPDNRYFTVTTWPPERAGQVFVDKTRTRVVLTKKVSKSDQ